MAVLCVAVSLSLTTHANGFGVYKSRKATKRKTLTPCPCACPCSRPEVATAASLGVWLLQQPFLQPFFGIFWSSLLVGCS